MGFISAMGECWGCRRTFVFNPFRVPSLTIDGERRPFCRDCIDRGNIKRREMGIEEIVPLPGAYEPADENEAADW